MIFSEIQLPANPEGEVPLTLEQVWKGLEQKARNAVPYVEAITECRVIHEESDTVFDREVLLGGARYVERIWLGKPYLVVFTRTAGPVLGTIINEILEEDGELSLRFQFRRDRVERRRRLFIWLPLLYSISCRIPKLPLNGRIFRGPWDVA